MLRAPSVRLATVLATVLILSITAGCGKEDVIVGQDDRGIPVVVGGLDIEDVPVELAGLDAPEVPGALAVGINDLSSNLCDRYSQDWNALYPAADLNGLNGLDTLGPALCTWEDPIEGAGDGHNHATITMVGWPPGIDPVDTTSLPLIDESEEGEASDETVHGNGELVHYRLKNQSEIAAFCMPDRLSGTWSEAYELADSQGLMDAFEESITDLGYITDTSGLAVTNRIEMPKGSGEYEVGATANIHLRLFDSWVTFQLSGLAATAGDIEVGEGVYEDAWIGLGGDVRPPLLAMKQSIISLACDEGQLLQAWIASALDAGE